MGPAADRPGRHARHHAVRVGFRISPRNTRKGAKRALPGAVDAVFVVVMLQVRGTEPADESRSSLVALLWREGAVCNRPFIDAVVEGQPCERAVQAMFGDPGLGFFARRKRPADGGGIIAAKDPDPVVLALRSWCVQCIYPRSFGKSDRQQARRLDCTAPREA